MVSVMRDCKPKLCLKVGEGLSNKCSGNEPITYYPCLPLFCGRAFTFSLTDSSIRVSFPYTTEGRESGTTCIEVIRDIVRIYGPEALEDVFKEVVESLLRLKEPGVIKRLKALFSAIAAHYHSELAGLDPVIEDSIHKVVEGRLKAASLYRVYMKAVKLHRGVHGLIYALRKVSAMFEGLEGLVTDAVMLENMYSTSLDRITETFNLHYTVTSEKTNNVVTKLTVISAIFLPLTLMAGIYGMNFKYMPELNNPLAYPITLVVMGLIVAGELIYFKHKEWI